MSIGVYESDAKGSFCDGESFYLLKSWETVTSASLLVPDTFPHIATGNRSMDRQSNISLW